MQMRRPKETGLSRLISKGHGDFWNQSQKRKQSENWM